MKTWTEYIIEAKQKYKDGYLGLNCVASTHDGCKIALEIVYFSITSPSPTYATSWHAGCWANHENTGEIIHILNFGDTPPSTIQTFPAPWDSLTDLNDIEIDENENVG